MAVAASQKAKQSGKRGDVSPDRRQRRWSQGSGPWRLEEKNGEDERGEAHRAGFSEGQGRRGIVQGQCGEQNRAQTSCSQAPTKANRHPVPPKPP